MPTRMYLHDHWIARAHILAIALAITFGLFAGGLWILAATTPVARMERVGFGAVLACNSLTNLAVYALLRVARRA